MNMQGIIDSKESVIASNWPHQLPLAAMFPIFENTAIPRGTGWLLSKIWLFSQILRIMYKRITRGLRYYLPSMHSFIIEQVLEKSQFMNPLSTRTRPLLLSTGLLLVLSALTLASCNSVPVVPPATAKAMPTNIRETPTITPIPYSLCLFVTDEDDGSAVAGGIVALAIVEGTYTSEGTTNKIGEVCWRNLPSATIDLVINKAGYFKKEETLTLNRGRNGVVIRIARATCRDLELLGGDPLNFPTYHVQGLAVTEDFYYISSVDRDNNRGWLFKVDRNALVLREAQELTNGALIHPGGIEMDGAYLWIPNAEYDRDGPTEILAFDTKSLELSRTFNVNDHISLIASNGRDRLYGTNWDSVNFYVWDWDGVLIEMVANPTSVAYQDCDFSDPYLICGGTRENSRNGTIDFIDPRSWTLAFRIEVGNTRLGNPLTREGLSLFGNKVFLLPEDGPDSEIMIYQGCGIP